MRAEVFLLLAAATSIWGQEIPGNTYSDCIQTRKHAYCNHNDNKEYRTIDGTCNNLRHPTVGSTNTTLRRLIPPIYVDNVDMPMGFPNANDGMPPPNKVSGALFETENDNKGTKDLSILFMTFGQFLDHDLSFVNHAECKKKDCGRRDSFLYPCFPVLFELGRRDCTPFGRSSAACLTHQERSNNHPRNQVNLITAFMDASMIYGSDYNQNRKLRRSDGTGRLKLNYDYLLRLDRGKRDCKITGGCSLAGDRRADENIALNSMHTIWVREHNRIARELKIINPRWGEEKLFQTARKIIGGMLQHIVYKEWLPNIVRLGPYPGYNPRKDPQIANAFTTAAFRFGHSLVPNKFPQLDHNFDEIYRPVELQVALRNRRLLDQRGIEPTVYGLIGNRTNDVDTGFAFGIMRRLFIKVGKRDHVDLTALNIQRGRDHGIPLYKKWREACGLPQIRSWYDLRRYMLPKTAGAFQRAYRSVDDIDLFAGGMSERHVPGLIVGPTFECIFRYQFTRLQDADRFFYKNPGVFNYNQLREIEKVSMARILCNAVKGIVSVQPKAFNMHSHYNRRISCERIPIVDLRAWRSH